MTALRARTRGAALLGALLLLAPLTIVPGAHAGTDSPAPAAMATGAPAADGEDLLLQALRDELARSVEKLRLEGMDRPYFLEYAVEDRVAYTVSASFGAVVSTAEDRDRALRVDVRVGDYAFDSSAFLGENSYFSFYRNAPRSLVEEDDVVALRRDLWLATDTAYKQALDQIARKRAVVETRVNPEELPDFSREEPVEAVAPRRALALDTVGHDDMVRRLSSLFRELPGIQSSGVELHVRLANRYIVNSEGSVVRQPDGLAWLRVRASTQAGDGMQLRHHVAFHEKDVAALPDEEQAREAIATMAAELQSMAAAPVLESYVGPVLVTGRGAAEIFLQGLAPHLSGERPPLVEEERMRSMADESKLASRLKRRVLPTFLSVTDEPTRTAFDDRPLLGSYLLDDQAVRAADVTLIEKGFLRSMLMSRRPRKEITSSNGHGRGRSSGGPRAQIGNLIVAAQDGKSLDELKSELRELCRLQDLPYGLLIRGFDDTAISAGGGAFPFFFMSGGRSRGPLSAPTLVYRVWAEDGREELVRGAAVKEFTVRSFKDILAAGADAYVHNTLVSASGPFSGFSRFGGVPASVVAPPVLIEEIELERDKGPQKAEAYLPHPFFERTD